MCVCQVSRFELQNGTVQWWRIMNDELLDGQGTENNHGDDFRFIWSILGTLTPEELLLNHRLPTEHGWLQAFHFSPLVAMLAVGNCIPDIIFEKTRQNFQLRWGFLTEGLLKETSLHTCWVCSVSQLSRSWGVRVLYLVLARCVGANLYPGQRRLENHVSPERCRETFRRRATNWNWRTGTCWKLQNKPWWMRTGNIDLPKTSEVIICGFLY